MMKDATIREIHHRVKNNLQTVASLLRLQSRRNARPEVREALAESERRIRSIALVHETLSLERGRHGRLRPGGRADRGRWSARASPGPEVEITVEGSVRAGRSPMWPRRSPWSCPSSSRTRWSTPSTREGGASTSVSGRAGGRTPARGSRRRPGPPDGFDLDDGTGLGLQIARTLVESELGGTDQPLGRRRDPGDGRDPGPRVSRSGVRQEGHDAGGGRQETSTRVRIHRRLVWDPSGETPTGSWNGCWRGRRGTSAGDGDVPGGGAASRRRARRMAGARPRRSHPRRRSPGRWRGPTRGIEGERHIRCRRLSPRRSVPRPGRCCRPGRRTLGPRPCTWPDEPTPSRILPLGS